MKTALRCAQLVVVMAIVSPFANASIDSLWSSSSTTGYKCALSNYSTGKVTYLCALDSVAGACRIYDADNFTQVYSPAMSCGSYTYLWYNYINDANGNGHPEILVYEYSLATSRYTTRIVDLSTGAVVRNWSSGSYSYFPKFMGTTPGSNTVKLGIERSSGTAGSFRSVLSVYSLGVTGVAAGPGEASKPGIILEQSHPNPAAEQVVVEFMLSRPGRATVTVYDQLGREVRVLADRDFPAGRHTLGFDGRGLPNGAYFYRLSTADGAEVKRLLLVK
jgi:hypothetical protein